MNGSDPECVVWYIRVICEQNPVNEILLVLDCINKVPSNFITCASGFHVEEETHAL